MIKILYISIIWMVIFLVALAMGVLLGVDRMYFSVLFIYSMLVMILIPCWYLGGVELTCPICKTWLSGVYHSTESTSDPSIPPKAKYKCEKCNHEWLGDWLC